MPSCSAMLKLPFCSLRFLYYIMPNIVQQPDTFDIGEFFRVIPHGHIGELLNLIAILTVLLYTNNKYKGGRAVCTRSCL